MNTYNVVASYYPDDRRKRVEKIKAVVLAENEEQAKEKFIKTQGPLKGWFVSAYKFEKDVFIYKM